MLMMDHKSDIEHILHDLEQIEHSHYDDREDLELLEHSRIMAREVTEELMALLHNIEAEELTHNGMVYDPKMIEDMCMISYHLSFYGWQHMLDMTQSLEETCMICADKIGCNAMSLMNMKAMYDDYIYSRENTWSKARELPEDMTFVMEICDNMTQGEVLMACHRILGLDH